MILTACAPANNQTYVTRDAAALTAEGRPYRFKGFNIYNANSSRSCGYPLAGGQDLDRTLQAIGNRSQNAFRAWFYQRLATTAGGGRDWTAFDHTLAVAAAHGQRVVAVLGDQWGDCETADGQPGLYKSESWYRSGYRDQRSPGEPGSYRDWVKEVVRRYRNEPAILAWQLMNEAEDADARGGTCSASAAETLRSWAADVAGLVKSLDRHHLVSVGTIGSGQCGASGMDYVPLHAIPAVDLCEYHDYGHPDDPLPGDRFNGLAIRIQECRQLGKPLFVGELGILASQAGSIDNRARLIDRKLSAAFGAGAVGILLWAWNDAEHGGSSNKDYEIGPSDPAIDVLARY